MAAVVKGNRLKCFLLFVLLIATYRIYPQPNISPVAISVKSRIDSLNADGYKSVRTDAAAALVMFVQAEQLALKHHYYKGLAASYVNEAEVFSQRGYYKRALVMYYRSMAIAKNENDEYNIALCRQHISTVMRSSGNYTEAKRLLDYSLSVFIRLNKPVDIANVQLRLGLVAAAQNKYADASRLYEKAYQVCKHFKYRYGEKKSYYNRGLLFKKLNQADSALIYFNKALKIDTLTHDAYGKVLSYIEIAQIYFSLHQLKTAQQYARLTFTNADSTGGTVLTTQAAHLMVDAFKKQNNMAGVIEWQNRLLTIDSIITIQEKKDAIAFIDILKQQQENQERYMRQIKTINKVSQEKTIFIISCLVLLATVIILSIPLIYNYRKARLYASELTLSNEKIQDKSLAVEQLNRRIIIQNKDLEQDNNLKNKLLSIISHDLRHPLVNTRSLLEVFNEGLLSPGETRKLFSQLEAQYVRTITLLDNLLFWIKTQVQYEAAAKTDNSVAQLISELIDEQKVTLHSKSIQVINRVNSLAVWHTDREALRIVFRNLLNNALKYTADHGVIEFRLFSTKDSTGIVVQDNGVGMEPAKLKKLTESINLNINGSAHETGTGFGLMLVKDLISREGGTLVITSAPDAGSTFTISFPKSTMLGQPQPA